MRIYEFRVLGMNCASCAAAAQRAVKRVHGVECCGVTLANERLRVRGDGVSCVSVIEALKNAVLRRRRSRTAPPLSSCKS